MERLPEAPAPAPFDHPRVRVHGQRPLVGRRDRLHRGDIDELAAARARALEQRRLRGDRRRRSRHVRRPRPSALHRLPVRLAIEIQIPPGRPVGERTVAPPRIRTGQPEPGDDHVHGPDVGRLHALIEPRRALGVAVDRGHNDVRPRQQLDRRSRRPARLRRSASKRSSTRAARSSGRRRRKPGRALRCEGRAHQAIPAGPRRLPASRTTCRSRHQRSNFRSPARAHLSRTTSIRILTFTDRHSRRRPASPGIASWDSPYPRSSHVIFHRRT